MKTIEGKKRETHIFDKLKTKPDPTMCREFLLYENLEDEYNALEFIDVLRDVVKRVPKEYRDAIFFDLEYMGEEGGVVINFSYLRPETDEERDERIENFIEAEEYRKDLETYNQLKAKHGFQ